MTEEKECQTQTNYEREINIYEQYQSIVSYFIAELEVQDTEFPIELFNEIRSILTHLSRFKLQNSEADLVSAERHIKRAILDCFKYMCISYAEEVNNFRRSYKNVDLKVADNGNFLPQLDTLERKVRETYLQAKKLEVKRDVPDDAIYQAFQEAYEQYKVVSDFLRDSNEAILFASSHSKTKNTINIISIIITAISIAIAIFSFVR